MICSRTGGWEVTGSDLGQETAHFCLRKGKWGQSLEALAGEGGRLIGSAVSRPWAGVQRLVVAVSQSKKLQSPT